MSVQNPEKIAVVLAMHGSPPKDFPNKDLANFFGLHLKIEHMPYMVDEKSKQKHHELEAKIQQWPRTKDNDPFYSSSFELAAYINRISGHKVWVGFNEFCIPTVEEALEEAIQTSPEKIIVITPMMTPGGEHSEIDIPSTIAKIKSKYPNVYIKYAWPFKFDDVAEFLISQVSKYL